MSLPSAALQSGVDMAVCVQSQRGRMEEELLSVSLSEVSIKGTDEAPAAEHTISTL